jgi:hypothetical protein
LSSWLRASPTSSRPSSQRASSVLASCHLHRLGCLKFMQSLENAQAPCVDSYCAGCVSLNIILRAENAVRGGGIDDAEIRMAGRTRRAMNGPGARNGRETCAEVNRELSASGDALEWMRGP